MILTELQIHQLRSISLLKCILHPRFNLFFGPNGSGKTSILESIYLLSTGHSFRTREISPLIQYDKESLTIFARTNTEDTLSLQKANNSPTKILLNKTPCRSASELAHFLPTVVIYQDLFEIMDAGPSYRRKILDWGVFHVKHSYLPLWKEYQRVIKQRNSLLRKKASSEEFVPWNNLLVELSEKITAIRIEYFCYLQSEFVKWVDILSAVPCTINFYKGWDRRETGKSLSTILENTHSNDLHKQYTQYGAHQADIIFHTTFDKTKSYLSRGQQKILLICLKLAQASLLNKPCLYLFDDLASELDEINLRKILSSLSTLQGQFYITGHTSLHLTQEVIKECKLFELE